MGQILTATTSADQSDIIVVSANDAVTVVVTGTIASGEYADIQYTSDGGSTWKDLYQDGSQVRLTDTNLAVTIYGPGIYRVDKDATAASCGIRRFD